VSEGLSRVEGTVELLRKFDRPGPRYTSYPTAVEFRPDYGESDYLADLARADEAQDEPLSLYVHLPFCRQRCWFCGCNVIVTRNYEVASRYLGYLRREIELLARRLPRRRRVSQYHWGGGTPTYLSLRDIEALHGAVRERFDLDPGGEIAVEVDPRVTSREQMELFRSLGFNRVSMGVQDFTPEVQAAVHRDQTEEETRSLFDTCRRLGFHSINVDMIYGLPLQTPDSFERSMDVLLALRPDRVALYSYAHVPWIRAQQKYIRPEQLPPAETKLRLFSIGREKMLEAGYVQIGMDHFALPGDELAQALAERRLTRNFMGYTVLKGSDMIGAGVSAISDVRGSYAQNTKKLSAYYAALEAGRLPIERGYRSSPDDRIRREVITRLMCNFCVRKEEIERAFGIRFDAYFEAELAEMAAPGGLAAHGFIELHADRIEIVGAGRLFVRNAAMVFDRYLAQKKPDALVFSRTV
jgi:oxygen-independent coproporphyrinogen-3 oxidase